MFSGNGEMGWDGAVSIPQETVKDLPLDLQQDLGPYSEGGREVSYFYVSPRLHLAT